jgi:hypothetical protein
MPAAATANRIHIAASWFPVAASTIPPASACSRSSQSPNPAIARRAATPAAAIKRPKNPQGKRCGDTENGNTDLQERVEKEWPRYAICPPAEQDASQREAGEKRAHTGCHRIDIDANP